jgi:hypothetical protein
MAKAAKNLSSTARIDATPALSKCRPNNARASHNSLGNEGLGASGKSRKAESTGLESLARAALESLILNKKTPPAALASAIRTALQLTGALDPHRATPGPPESDPEAMTAADIDAALERMRKPRKAPNS